MEHKRHIGDFARIEVTDISITKIFATIEHTSHRCDFTRVQILQAFYVGQSFTILKEM
jgi:hypothetical protein